MCNACVSCQEESVWKAISVVICGTLGRPVLWCDHKLWKEVLKHLPGFVLHVCAWTHEYAMTKQGAPCVVTRVDAMTGMLRMLMAHSIVFSPCPSFSPPVFPPASRFFKELEDRHQQNIVIDDISDIVIRHAQTNFDPYVTYCSNEVYQQRTLQKLLWVQHKQVRKFFIILIEYIHT